MTATDLAAGAVLLTNIWGGLAGLAAARAWWPRHQLACEPRSTRIFYVALIGLMLAFAGNSSVRAAEIIADWPPMLGVAGYDDLLWRVMGGAACFAMILSKLLALPASERASWNIITVILHPDADQLVVQFWNAAARRMRRRRREN